MAILNAAPHSAGNVCKSDMIFMFVKVARRTLYCESVMRRWSAERGVVKRVLLASKSQVNDSESRYGRSGGMSLEAVGF